MGRYLNPSFDTSLSEVSPEELSQLTRIVAYTNASQNTVRNLTCVTAPCSFGKTQLAQRLSAYYSRGSSQKNPFSSFKITREISQFLQSRCLTAKTFADFLHQRDILFWNMRDFVTKFADQALPHLQEALCHDLRCGFSLKGAITQKPTVADLLAAVDLPPDHRFFIIIDDWDAPFLLLPEATTFHKDYLTLLRSLFSTSLNWQVIAGAYLTGTLPLRHCGAFPYLADFQEFSFWGNGGTSSYFYSTVPYDNAVPKSFPLLTRSLAHCSDEAVDVLQTLINGRSALLDRTRLPINFMEERVHAQFMLSLLVDLGWLSFDPATDRVSFTNESSRQTLLKLLKTVCPNPMPITISAEDSQ